MFNQFRFISFIHLQSKNVKKIYLWRTARDNLYFIYIRNITWYILYEKFIINVHLKTFGQKIDLAVNVNSLFKAFLLYVLLNKCSTLTPTTTLLQWEVLNEGLGGAMKEQFTTSPFPSTHSTRSISNSIVQELLYRDRCSVNHTSQSVH